MKKLSVGWAIALALFALTLINIEPAARAGSTPGPQAAIQIAQPPANFETQTIANAVNTAGSPEVALSNGEKVQAGLAAVHYSVPNTAHGDVNMACRGDTQFALKSGELAKNTNQRKIERSDFKKQTGGASCNEDLASDRQRRDLGRR